MQSQVYSGIFKGTSNTVMQGTWHLEFITPGSWGRGRLEAGSESTTKQSTSQKQGSEVAWVYEDGYPRHVGVQLLMSVAVTACPVW